MSKRRNAMTALAVVVGVLTTGCSNRATPEQITSTPSQTASNEAAKPTTTPAGEPRALAPTNVQFLESKLVSSNKTQQALALVPGYEGKGSNSAVLPPRSKLSIDQKSFRVADNGYATVNASVTGSVQGEFILHLALVDEQWLIYYQTERKR